MSGSNKWFEYKTDDGTLYGVYGDESNGELVGSTDINATVPKHAVPRNVTPRHIVYASDDKRIVRRIICDTVARFLDDALTPPSITYPITALETGAVIATHVLRRIGRVPERTRVITSGDTGLNDGDVT